MLGLPLLRGFGSAAFRRPAGAAGDATAPTISTVVEVAQGYDPYLFVNRGLVLKATFSEPMDPLTGTGTRIAVNFGGTTKYCTFSSWSSTTEALYVYLLDGTEHDEDGLTVSSPIDLNGGTLKDVAGNDATLTFSAPSLSSFRVVLRGMVWGTDFTQGADAQKLYSAIGNTTITSDTGTLGSTTGSDAEDPSFENYGMSFGAGLYVKDIGSNGQFDRLGNTSLAWSIHFRVRIDVSVSGAYAQLFNCGNYSTGGGGNFHGYTSAGNLGLTYENPGYASASWNAGLSGAQWATFSFVCAGAGSVKCYVNGALISAQSVSVSAAANLKAEIQKANGLGAAWANGMPFRARCIAYCTVEHSADEVDAVHDYFAQMANAA